METDVFSVSEVLLSEAYEAGFQRGAEAGAEVERAKSRVSAERILTVRQWVTAANELAFENMLSGCVFKQIEIQLSKALAVLDEMEHE